MTRVRLRPAYSPERLAEVYATPHDHCGWSDHRLRVAATIEVARWLAEEDEGVRSAADLSCGDGAVLRGLKVEDRHFGDLAPGYPHTGPVEETIQQIPPVDLFVSAETVEHLDDPDAVLKAVRGRTRLLVLSTPVDAFDDDNAEHYWAWSRTGVEDMLFAAGFEVAVFTAVDFRPMGLPYCFGIWGCR
jgi:hypothetical protein